MVQLIARRSLVYAGKRVAKGGAFAAQSERDAFLLTSVAKSAERAPVEPAEPVTTADVPGLKPEPAKRKRGRPRKEKPEGPPPAAAAVPKPEPTPPAEEPAPPAPIDPPKQDEQPEGASPVGTSTGLLRPGGRFFRRRDMEPEE